jgi:lipoyl-dependent peroxiredoxin subunit D
MPALTLPPPAELSEKARATLERVAEALEGAAVPPAFQVHARSEAFVQDFHMNFKKFVLSDGKLPAKAKALIGYAVAAEKGAAEWQGWFAERCRALGWTDGELADALAISATCAMYNVFFKFRALSGSQLFEGMSVGLRAHAFTATSLDQPTVELLNIVVSDLNGCPPCVSGHVEKARSLGLADEAILEAVQCAATMVASIQHLKLTGNA